MRQNNTEPEEDYDFPIKMLLLVGADNCGKSNIVGRYNGKSYKLQIWDIPRPESFTSINTSHYRGTSVFFICYDITNRKSFEKLDFWLKCIDENAYNNPIKILVGIKADLKEIRAVSVDEGKDYAEEHGMPFLECSSPLAGEGIDLMFDVALKAKIRRDKLRWEEEEKEYLREGRISPPDSTDGSLGPADKENQPPTNPSSPSESNPEKTPSAPSYDEDDDLQKEPSAPDLSLLELSIFNGENFSEPGEEENQESHQEKQTPGNPQF